MEVDNYRGKCVDGRKIELLANDIFTHRQVGQREGPESKGPVSANSYVEVWNPIPGLWYEPHRRLQVDQSP